VAVKSAGDRMTLVRKLIGEWRVPTGDTPPLLGIVEPGGLSAFELASAYRIWQDLPAAQKAAVEKHEQGRNRREELFRKGARLKPPIPRETRPDDYDDEQALAVLHEYLRKNRPILDVEKKQDEQTTEAQKAFRHNVARRQAINKYVRESRGIRSVAPDRLMRFAASLPAWIQSTLDPLPPDEATRRLVFAYRLVFGDKEIGGSGHVSSTTTEGHTATVPVPRPSAPARPPAKSVPPVQSNEPF
jgi:hypothetical protein